MQPSKHGFIGAYTRDGYVMFDPERMLRDRASKRIRIRGGSEKARAAVMSAVARRITDRGFETNALHSARDPDILEGVVCPSLTLVITSADADEPCVNVDSADICIDLDESLRTVRSVGYQEMLSALMDEARSFELRAVHYMESAAPLRADAEEEYARMLNPVALDRLLAPWLETIEAHRDSQDGGVESRFFAEAVTSRGLVQYLDTVMMPRLWRVSGPWGGDFHTPLARLRDSALSRGLHVMCAMEACHPSRIAHLLIPELGLFITSEVNVHALASAAQRTIDLRLVMPAAENLSQHTLRALAFDELMCEQLMEKAAYSLELACKTRARIDRLIEERVDEQVQTLMTNAALAALEPAFMEATRFEERFA
ncbi:hypothetical protein AGMMS49992_09810 [Clostridia bacterium]|nr:hypothetical protein AGMMS49992_09810 [Clostridia bacterium]